MSSDESTSTQLSAVSSQASVCREKLKSHKSEQWEIKFIGNFVLSLYHRSLISPQDNWICKKSDMRQEFYKFVTPELRKRFKDLNGTDNIGTLLHRCGFLWNTPRGSPYYQITCKELFEFRNKELKERDRKRVHSDGGVAASVLGNDPDKEEPKYFEVSYEIDDESPVHELAYEGTTMQQRRQNYYPTNMACCICQIDFSSMDSYEEHIQKHNDETDFEYAKELSKFDSPIFKLSYRLCKNSHYFCFSFDTHTENLVIEKIIIVQSRTMFYVHDMRVPYEMPRGGSDKFYVDSHLFTLFVEQPVVIVSHLMDARETRIIEEHHFVRSLEFPKVNFAVKPYRLPSKNVFKPKFKLPEYFPPIEIQRALKDDFIYEKLMETSNEFRNYIRNEKILQPQTIGPTLTTLLHVEDMDTIREYLNLLQHNVTLRSFGDSYSFKIKPKQRVFIESILSTFDDVILTTKKVSNESEEVINLILTNQEDLRTAGGRFVGRIEDVNSGRVTFKVFAKKLDLKRSYTVIFRPARFTLRHQYRAMELLPVVMPYLKKFLFPGQLMAKSPSSMSLELFNKSIYHNPEQLQAVRNIAEGPRNDATYIIFGPPGTGKTTTLVESILQVVKREGTKVLVTASSNSACDEVGLRLCKALNADFDVPRAIARIYAQSSESRVDNIDDLLLEHSNMYNYVHFYPDIEVLHEYRIVICTMSVVAKLATGKFGRQEHGGALYTHLFIDEVAAATEVEALMPITSVLTPKSCLIIAGDNKQLGPVLKSKRAEELRLGVSLMDRLLARECYRVDTDTGDYDHSVQTRLRLNFRSHPAIVDLYSAMYYNHDLEARAKIEDVSLFKDWHLSPSKEYPIMFHCVNGRSKSDSNSFSLYNSEEINIVMGYVKDLMYFGINGNAVQESDIGIISPYKKQYLRIREELNLRKWYLIETGSVETFQGREKNIIIVSFVRSGTASLGFLESARRLNVTISRAKSLLILVGNTNTLCINPDFQHIFNECKRHNTVVGKAYHVSGGEGLVTLKTGNRLSNEGGNAAMELVNESLKDLKLKNQNHRQQQAISKNRNQRNIERAIWYKNRISNKEHKQKNNNDNDNDDDDDDDDEDDDSVLGVDDKPSTSANAAKRVANSASGKNNPIKARDLGKISKAYKADKPNATSAAVKTKDQQKSAKINLDSYFSGLPSVPKKPEISEAKVPQQTAKPPIAAPSNMMPPPAQAYQQFQQMPPHGNHFYPMPQHHPPRPLPMGVNRPFMPPPNNQLPMNMGVNMRFMPPPGNQQANNMTMHQHMQYQQQLQQSHRLLQQRQHFSQKQLTDAIELAKYAFPNTNPYTNVNQATQAQQQQQQKACQGENQKSKAAHEANRKNNASNAIRPEMADEGNISTSNDTKKLHQLSAGKVSKPYKVDASSPAAKNANMTKNEIKALSNEQQLTHTKMPQTPPVAEKSIEPEDNQYYANDPQTIYLPLSKKAKKKARKQQALLAVASTKDESKEENTSTVPNTMTDVNTKEISLNTNSPIKGMKQEESATTSQALAVKNSPDANIQLADTNPFCHDVSQTNNTENLPNKKSRKRNKKKLPEDITTTEENIKIINTNPFADDLSQLLKIDDNQKEKSSNKNSPTKIGSQKGNVATKANSATAVNTCTNANIKISNTNPFANDLPEAVANTPVKDSSSSSSSLASALPYLAGAFNRSLQKEKVTTTTTANFSLSSSCSTSVTTSSSAVSTSLSSSRGPVKNSTTINDVGPLGSPSPTVAQSLASVSQNLTLSTKSTTTTSSAALGSTPLSSGAHKNSLSMNSMNTNTNPRTTTTKSLASNNYDVNSLPSKSGNLYGTVAKENIYPTISAVTSSPGKSSQAINSDLNTLRHAATTTSTLVTTSSKSGASPSITPRPDNTYAVTATNSTTARPINHDNSINYSIKPISTSTTSALNRTDVKDNTKSQITMMTSKVSNNSNYPATSPSATSSASNELSRATARHTLYPRVLSDAQDTNIAAPPATTYTSNDLNRSTARHSLYPNAMSETKTSFSSVGYNVSRANHTEPSSTYTSNDLNRSTARHSLNPPNTISETKATNTASFSSVGYNVPKANPAEQTTQYNNSSRPVRNLNFDNRPSSKSGERSSSSDTKCTIA